MQQAHTSSPTVRDIVIVTTICFGWFIFGSIQAVAAGFPTRGFTNNDFLYLIILELVLAVAALSYLRLRSYDLKQLVPSPTANGMLLGLGLCALCVIASWLFQVLFAAAVPATQPIDEMVANAHISFVPLIAVSVINGLYEETFLLGYIQRAVESSGPLFAVGASLLVRVLYHLYQGPTAALSILGFGLVLGFYFMKFRKLWPVVFAHITADIAGFAIQ